MHRPPLVALACIVAACAPARAPSARGALAISEDVSPGASIPLVRLEMRKGTFDLGPSGANAPLLSGTIRANDDSLLPHVSNNRRGVAIVQDFEPDEANVLTAWELKLGAAPMRLDVHMRGSEQLHVDLGGRALVSARLFNDGGHLRVGWSASAAIGAEKIQLLSIGYLEAHDLGRARAKRIEVRSLAGLAELDVGTVVEPVVIDADCGAGSLVVKVPADVTARATAEATSITADGWTKNAAGAYETVADAPPAVTIAARVSAGSLTLVRQ